MPVSILILVAFLRLLPFMPRNEASLAKFKKSSDRESHQIFHPTLCSYAILVNLSGALPSYELKYMQTALTTIIAFYPKYGPCWPHNQGHHPSDNSFRKTFLTPDSKTKGKRSVGCLLQWEEMMKSSERFLSSVS